MSKNLKIKILVIAGVLLVCIYGLIGLPKSKEELVANWNRNIRLGLDLKGGSHLVLQVQVQDAFKAEALADVDRMKNDFNKNGITYSAMEVKEQTRLEDAGNTAVEIKGIPLDKTAAFRSVINDRFGRWDMSSMGSNDYRLRLKPTESLALRKDTVERTMGTIERRINSLGLAEATVQQRGRSDAEGEILVQLPGVDDPGRIKSLIQTAAMLEIAEVKGGPFATPEQANQQMAAAPGTRAVQQRMGSAADGPWFLISRAPVVTGRDVQNARPSQGQLGGHETQFTLSQDAARRFESYTGANIGNRLAVVMDNKIQTVATIQSKISDSGVIQGQSSEQESADLAMVLKAGSLPAGLVYLEERTVGPSLGADSIRSGLIAGVVGLVAVVLAMLVYYKKAGINATLALILNAVILIACLSYFDAVLTLPGIAGIILTIGMAVDSNVLIFERIREELRTGKSVIAAVHAGFSKALLTIVDTHVTTVVSCAFLFIFGNGPVKGFAVTLVIGLLANVFTAVFVSKAIFDWELSGKREPSTLSI